MKKSKRSTGIKAMYRHHLLQRTLFLRCQRSDVDRLQKQSQHGVICKELTAEEFSPIAKSMSSPPLHRPGTFVRVHEKGDLYNTCLAVVMNHDLHLKKRNVEVGVIPRIYGTRKRKRNGISIQAGLFDEDVYSVFYPTAKITKDSFHDFADDLDDSVETRVNGEDRFRHGLHMRKYTSTSLVREDFPRRDEMKALCLDDYIFKATLPQIETALKVSWECGTRIVVNQGTFKGVLGRTTALIDTLLSTVSVELENPIVHITLPLSEVSVHIEQGKNVRVLWGPRAGEIGLTAPDADAVDDHVMLYFADNSMVGCSHNGRSSL